MQLSKKLFVACCHSESAALEFMCFAVNSVYDFSALISRLSVWCASKTINHQLDVHL